MKNLFVYGTLMLKELFDQIVVNDYDSVRGHLKGYQRFKVIGEVYPALLRTMTSDQVDGCAFLNVSAEDLQRLDAFEGEMYHRISVEIVLEQGERLPVDTYLCGREYLHRVSRNQWIFKEFDKTAKEQFLNSFPGWETS